MAKKDVEKLSRDPKQVRARMRRQREYDEHERQIQEETGVIKPLEEWDLEELARGRPKNRNGKFSGPAPRWITRETHELAMERFKSLVKEEMAATTEDGLKAIRKILRNDDLDQRGRPVIPPTVKLQAAQFLIEQMVGRAVQPTTSDISVKLQGLLAQVTVIPGSEGAADLIPGWQGSRALEAGSDDDGDENAS
jgi:hypothetical protein